MRKPKIVFLTGPTAVGKSALAAALAKKIKAEIVSCDSMQIYKGMGVLTSKPQVCLLKKIPHHLLGVVSPEEDYNVSKYRQAALKKIAQIIKRGKTPLFAGGTGLYVSILVDGIFKDSAQDERLRRKLYAQAKKYGSSYLHKRLKRVDPASAVKIHPHDVRRIVRALEVYATSCLPISKLQKERQGLACDYDVRIFCLNMPRAKLYEKIDRRVEEMFAGGLEKEVRRLLKKKLSRTAFYAIGIRELKGYFEGKYDLAEAKRLIKRNTRALAKRQLTWFRRDKRIKWINISEKDKHSYATNRIVTLLNHPRRFLKTKK